MLTANHNSARDEPPLDAIAKFRDKLRVLAQKQLAETEYLHTTRSAKERLDELESKADFLPSGFLAVQRTNIESAVQRAHRAWIDYLIAFEGSQIFREPIPPTFSAVPAPVEPTVLDVVSPSSVSLQPNITSGTSITTPPQATTQDQSLDVLIRKLKATGCGLPTGSAVPQPPVIQKFAAQCEKCATLHECEAVKLHYEHALRLRDEACSKLDVNQQEVCKQTLDVCTTATECDSLTEPFRAKSACKAEFGNSGGANSASESKDNNDIVTLCSNQVMACSNKADCDAKLAPLIAARDTVSLLKESTRCDSTVFDAPQALQACVRFQSCAKKTECDVALANAQTAQRDSTCDKRFSGTYVEQCKNTNPPCLSASACAPIVPEFDAFTRMRSKFATDADGAKTVYRGTMDPLCTNLQECKKRLEQVRDAVCRQRFTNNHDTPTTTPTAPSSAQPLFTSALPPPSSASSQSSSSDLLLQRCLADARLVESCYQQEDCERAADGLGLSRRVDVASSSTLSGDRPTFSEKVLDTGASEAYCKTHVNDPRVVATLQQQCIQAGCAAGQTSLDCAALFARYENFKSSAAATYCEKWQTSDPDIAALCAAQPCTDEASCKSRDVLTTRALDWARFCAKDFGPSRPGFAAFCRTSLPPTNIDAETAKDNLRKLFRQLPDINSTCENAEQFTEPEVRELCKARLDACRSQGECQAMVTRLLKNQNLLARGLRFCNTLQDYDTTWYEACLRQEPLCSDELACVTNLTEAKVFDIEDTMLCGIRDCSKT